MAYDSRPYNVLLFFELNLIKPEYILYIKLHLHPFISNLIEAMTAEQLADLQTRLGALRRYL